ncbi:hypothetical protein niasHT_009827 [Heterodera trifolii]|uniref:Large ribosomal subunit protein uL29 n=1 Tax=Heterodera trifolii TaxID=157864 RepID=A0ABD2LRB8_9BILA
MTRVKTHELRAKKKEELMKMLEEQKTELASLQVAKVTNGAVSKLSNIHVVRKNIARILTKMNLLKFYKRKKYRPIDLRFKKTRAMRRELNKHELSLNTHKQKVKARRVIV